MKPTDKKVMEWLNSEQEYNLRPYTDRVSKMLDIHTPKPVIDWHVCNKEDVIYDEPFHGWASLSSSNEMYVDPELLHNQPITETFVIHEYLHESLQRKLKFRIITKILSLVPILKEQYEEKKVIDEISSRRPDLRPVLFSIYGFKYLRTANT